MNEVLDYLKARRLEVPRPYTEGVWDDGAAILKDGVRMRISEILDELNEYAFIKHCATLAARDKKLMEKRALHKHDLCSKVPSD